MKLFRYCFFLACLFSLAGPLHAETGIRILHTNDTHARIMPYLAKESFRNISGAVRRANLINKIKSDYPQSLLLDAGDNLQGTPFYSIFKGEACFRIARALGYEATTLGNHELDNSLANLLEKLQMSGLRLLCCNVFYRNTDKPVFRPYHVFKRNGKKIAVIGSIGDEAWDGVDIMTKAPLYATPQIGAVRKTAKRIRPYVDLIVVLSHAGFEPDEKMAAAISEIDVILGGHSHTPLVRPLLIKNSGRPDSGFYNNGLHGTIVAQAGKHGKFLGVLDVKLTQNSKIATFSGHLKVIDKRYDLPNNTEVAKMVNFYHKQLEAQMSQIAGHTERELSYPADLKKTHLLPMGSFAAEAMRHTGKADICLVNSGGIRSGMPAGDITWGHIYQALPYDNTVVTFLMRGSEIERMIKLLCHNNEKFDGFQFAGLEGTLNMADGQPENITINGVPLDKNKVYRVSTSSFVANGNLGGDLLFAKVESIENSHIFMRDAAIAYLQKNPQVPDFSQNKLSIKR
jgi:2',3'-cyclic-nucleotide 2'-phosphodiesterase (5'-nucleotidase family)